MDEELNNIPEESNTDKILEAMLVDSSQKGEEALRIAESTLESTGQTTDAVRSLEPVLEASLEVQDGIRKAIEKKSDPIQSMDEADEEMPQIVFRGLRGKPGKDGTDGHTPTNEELLALIKPLIPTPKQGPQGPKGDTGDPAVPPSREELLDLIRPLIPAPIPGHTPTNDELLALIKPLIPKPKAIKGDKGDPGSPDTGEDIVKKLLAVKDDPLNDLVQHLGIPAFKRGGGAGYLRELSDVDLSGIQNGYTLVWNATTGKWGVGQGGGGSGSAAWGDITGTLSNQTDLQSALDAKYDADNPDGFISGVAWGDITGTLASQTDLQNALDAKVPTTTTVNGYALSSNVTLDTDDIAEGSNLYFTDERAQDAVGGILDSNSLSYDDGTPSIAVKRQMSITADASGIKLSGDSATPGNSKYYGTDSGGTKGFFDLPAGGTPDWGDIGGTLADQTDLQSALDAKVPTSTTVNGYALSSNVTLDTGDISENGNLYFTDERAQDAVGGILDDGSNGDIDFTYADATPLISAAVKNDAITYAKMQNVSATDKLLGRVTTGAGDVEEVDFTDLGQTIVASATAADVRTALGLVIGTDVQAYSANLTTWAGKTAPSGTVVGTSDSQTLTNKTLTTPTIGDFTNATHDHEDAAGGGQLGEAALSLSDNTTNDVSTTKHGFVPKAPNDSGKYLAGDGAWTDLPAAAGAPTGSVAMWVTASAPTGYLLCDGSAVSRTTYSDLFAIIGTTYGVGDGSTTFNVPNFKGKVPVGLDAAQTEFDALAETGGAKTHTLTESEMPAHTHGSPSGQLLASGSSNKGGTSSNSAHTEASTSSTGGGGAHNNLQPYLVINFIIKT